MAEGEKYYDASGNFDNAQDFDNAQSADSGNQSEVADDGKNTAGYGSFGRKQDEEGNNKWGLLKKGEKDASEKPNAKGKGGDKNASLGEKEGNVKSDSNSGSNEEDDSVGGKYKNAVKGLHDIQNGRFFQGLRRFRKAGPVLIILMSLFTFGGGMFFGQMAMPFSLISQFQEQFDSIRASQNLRSKNFLRWQTVRDTNVKDCIRAHYFKPDEFKVSAKQKSKLEKSHITFETDSNGVTVMRHVKGNGEVQIIVADKSLATDGKIYFEDAFDSDTEFRSNYTEGSRTWRGSIGAWFDSSMDKLLRKLGVQRGVWRDFQSGKTHAENMDEMKKTVAADSDSDSAKAKAGSSDTNEKQELDEDKNPVKDKDGNNVYEKDGDGRNKQYVSHGSEDDVDLSRSDVKTDSKGNVVNTDGLKGKLNTIASKVSKISGAVEASVAIYCGVQDFLGAVHGIIAAYQTMQVIRTAANIFEGIQKAQAGDGDSAPIHEISQSLVQRTYNSYEVVDDVKKTGDSSVETSSTVIERERSAMEANAIGASYGGTEVDMNDPSVRSYNINTVTKVVFSGVSKILGNVSASASNYRKCTTARLAAAQVGVATDVITVGLCVATFGIGCLVDWLVDAAAGIGFSAAFSLAISTVISIAVPHIANVLIRKIATEVAGEDLGNAIVTGANMYMGRNHQYSGGAAANKESYITYLQEQDRIIAEEARYERETRSPFDITSKYTFLGSLANQMIPLASSSSSLTGIVKGVSSVISGAVSSLTPHSSAVSAGIDAQAAEDRTKKYCPDLAEIGAIGDFSCEKYTVTDYSTMDTHPADIVNSISKDDLISDDNGNPVIVEGSMLDYYIRFCGQRSSQLGFADQNIANEIDTAGNIGGSVGQAIIGAIPIVGDGFDIVSNEAKLNNFPWISGEACVIGNKSESEGYKRGLDWNETKKYQRFIEDQRLAEAEGIIKESAVTKFLAKYYEEHPVDTSYEGLLARYSGLTKDNVETTLAFLELSVWVADYNPAGLAPYGNKKEMIREDTNYQIEQSNIVANIFMDVASKYDGFIERRNAYNYSA